MKTKFKTSAILLLAMISISTGLVYSQDKKTEERGTYSIETDPATFAFGGFAAHIRLKPCHSDHWVFGAGVYAMDYPDFLVNMISDNKDKGWNVRINSAFGLFGEYYFKEANSKWFTGLQVGLQNYKITNDNIANAEAKYSNILIMPSIGYNWQPFRVPFYIKPWLGLGYTAKISGENSINTATYKIAPITAFVTVHVGYTF